MKITILTEDFKLAKKDVTPKEAAEFIGCTLTTVYQNSLTGYNIKGFYLARAENPETINRILAKGIASLSENTDRDGVKSILQKCIKELRGL